MHSLLHFSEGPTFKNVLAGLLRLNNLVIASTGQLLPTVLRGQEPLAGGSDRPLR